MDWITLVARNNMVPTVWSQDINVKSVQIYTYISTTDIIVEAVQQLHRVFFKTDKVPFSGEKKYFSNAPETQDDNRFFKQVRATFGAHPVDLKDHNGQWFASWPYDHYQEKNYDIQLRLYSRDVGKEDISFGLNLAELTGFLESRYGYLDVLIQEIEAQYRNFCAELANVPILKVIQSIQDVELLRAESKKRLNLDYYRWALEEISLLLSATTGNDLFLTEELAYKKELLLLADEIRENLQLMTFGELAREGTLDLPYLYDKLGYAIEKLYTFDFDRTREPLFSVHIAALNKYCNGKYQFTELDSPGVLRLKLKLMLAWKRNSA